ncbi:MAG: hypothetical protein KDA47_14350 [Planctomycetales bacterium]|nr:hypothetical protein [Planctomycetales bacterium]
MNLIRTRCRRCWIPLLAVFMIVGFATVAHACPTCKDGLGNDPDRAGMVEGYFWSILFMMSMPFLILSGIGTYFYLQIRRARQAGYGDDVRALIAESERAAYEGEDSPFESETDWSPEEETVNA